jgi:septum formation topological specificity factor MinE
MIDDIFEMIMKEARSRPGKDLIPKINKVLLEVTNKVISAEEELEIGQRRQGENEI